ncbi:uncharacterized protein SPSK_00620 [Sporothrix schenckii 1099-18]|uniref:Uncharacterized protein n=1 Tax=Sporothrix schenckii 1099-18 TaxID=1397361 RepID=A0A0F2LR39_SPOSC|nr:uncharacterized protein SPSK_00620 [Sporothrix schenckii 1099-18]KJR79972.1 hypothetical protein SPSK_00620 [Sporothrix schenckii 1099-18]
MHFSRDTKCMLVTQHFASPTNSRLIGLTPNGKLPANVAANDSLCRLEPSNGPIPGWSGAWDIVRPALRSLSSSPSIGFFVTVFPIETVLSRASATGQKNKPSAGLCASGNGPMRCLICRKVIRQVHVVASKEELGHPGETVDGEAVATD